VRSCPQFHPLPTPARGKLILRVDWVSQVPRNWAVQMRWLRSAFRDDELNSASGVRDHPVAAELEVQDASKLPRHLAYEQQIVDYHAVEIIAHVAPQFDLRCDVARHASTRNSSPLACCRDLA